MIVADRGDAGLRLDLVLRRHLTGVPRATRTRVQAWIEDGLVRVNDAPVRRVSTRAACGDVVSIALPGVDPGGTPMAPEPAAIDVLYEDDVMLVVDKPAGVVVHPAHRNRTGTLMNALLWHARAWAGGQRPSLVGRLDRLTSGLVVVARSAPAHKALQAAMASDATVKEYLALVYGRVNAARGEIDLCLRRDPGDRRRVVASAGVGAPSLTRFERLARGSASQAGLSLLRCRLVTGRTHQIRVHLAARGWPIVGDPTYGAPRWREIGDPVVAAALRDFPRQALHAWRLTIRHPLTGEALALESPIPPDLDALLRCCGVTHSVFSG